MVLTSTHFATLVVILLSMLCLGLWANTFKAAGKWRPEMYYFDFAVGAMAAAIIAALTVGTLGFDGFSFTDDLLHASKKQDVLGFAGGIVFNFGNMLLLTAVSVAGMSIAFTLAAGVALCTATILNYISRPAGNTAILFAGASIVLAAIAAAVIANRFLQLSRYDELVKTGKVKSTKRSVSVKGVIVSVVSGFFLGCFSPLLEKSQAGDSGLGPYGLAFVFTAGIAMSTVLFNLFFMNLPVDGPPLEIVDYFKGTLRQHGLGFLGGLIWCAGAIGMLVASHAEGAAAAEPSLTFGATQASGILAALCGVLVWREFKDSDGRTRALLVVMFALFICGVAMISVANGWTQT